MKTKSVTETYDNVNGGLDRHTHIHDDGKRILFPDELPSDRHIHERVKVNFFSEEREVVSDKKTIKNA